MAQRKTPTIPRINPKLPPSADPLCETLHLLKFTGVLYCRSELTAPWGIDLPPLEGCMMVEIVTVGQCWLEVEGEEPCLLQQGSLVLIPHGTGHRIRSSPTAESKPLSEIPIEQVSDRYEIMRYGGGGDFAHITYCGVRFDHVPAQRLTALLPKVLHVETFDQDDEWLQNTIRFISREANEMRPGGETIITRLADILVIQAIRSWIDASPEAEQGWLAALRDKQVGRALAMIHREPEKNWTVASLAKEVGMSRSGFSARFTNLVGESVMHYLTHWRMQLARRQLQETSDPLSVLAYHHGYQSEAAFSRAFKREFGVSPGSIRHTTITSV
ncbi:MAG: AraC family transcriptional regulator [Gammaproteobacteria bacterium]|nr:AraC family transcriptional regulator [Gammaproteobacteria bacterium]